MLEKTWPLFKIDPRHMQDVESAILYQFLIENNQVYFQKNHVYLFIMVLENIRINFSFYFPFDIVKRHSNNIEKDDIYEIISDEEVGRGRAVVRKSNGVFFAHRESQKVVFKESKQRAVKIEKRSGKNATYYPMNGYQLSSRLSYSKIKEPTFVELPNGKVLSLTVMGLQPGEDFGNLLEKDMEATSSDEGYINLAERFAITLKLLQALADVHKQGIVHRDIKPENISIQRKPLIVRIIDLDLGKWVGMDDSDKLVGITRYLSPEAKAGLGTNEKSDIYALGLILYFFWKDKLDVRMEEPYRLITFTIEQMLAVDRDERLTLKQAIKNFKFADEMLCDYSSGLSQRSSKNSCSN